MKNTKVMFYIKFDERTVQAHATIMSQFCNVLWKIQNMYEEGLHIDPVKIKVFVPEWYRECYIGPEHEYHSMQQLQWFMDNFEQPGAGVTWEVEFYKEKTTTTSPWNTNCIWPLKKERQWVGGGGYITLQKYKQVSGKKFNYFQEIAKNSGQLEVIENIAEYSDLPVKVIDYKHHPENFFESLKYSERHFTYLGGSYYSAALINCPTICYGFPYGDVYPDSLNGKSMPGSAWGSDMGNGHSTICQYDFEKTFNGPQVYVTHANTVNDLKGFLLRIK